MTNMTVDLEAWVCMGYEYQTIGDGKPVVITAPRDYLIRLEHDGHTITVSARDLRKAIDAIAVMVTP